VIKLANNAVYWLMRVIKPSMLYKGKEIGLHSVVDAYVICRVSEWF